MDLITGDLICRYNGYLASRGVIRNSISFYNRTLRAIYNKAVRRFNASDTLPFRDVYTGIDKTRSRAIDEKQVARLAGLKFGGNKNLEVARDLFIFSYATRGMSFVDMAYLRKSNVKGNCIIYSRKKSGARMEVKIEPPVAARGVYEENQSSEALIFSCPECPGTEKSLYLRHSSFSALDFPGAERFVPSCGGAQVCRTLQ